MKKTYKPTKIGVAAFIYVLYVFSLIFPESLSSYYPLEPEELLISYSGLYSSSFSSSYSGLPPSDKSKSVLRY
jgi:hypothetical protein